MHYTLAASTIPTIVFNPVYFFMGTFLLGVCMIWIGISRELKK